MRFQDNTSTKKQQPKSRITAKTGYTFFESTLLQRKHFVTNKLIGTSLEDTLSWDFRIGISE